MRRLYHYHLKIHRRIQRMLKSKDANGNKQVFTRQISAKEQRFDHWMNRKNHKRRVFAQKRKNRLVKKSENNGHIFGSKYRFQRRPIPTMKAHKLSHNMRTTLHSGIDNPLSFMFNEMQRQNKIHGQKRKRFVFPKRKGFLGPRYKVQTRIGKLHHMNIGNRYFEGIDD